MAKKVTVKELIDTPDYKALLQQLTFEEGLSLLDELVASVESGELALERSITSYERGVGLLDHLRSVLNKAEEKLKLLGPGGSVSEIEV